MTIFPFRLVLNTGEVLRPEEIQMVEICPNTNEVFIGTKNDYWHLPTDKVRLDLATGMKDIYVNSRVKYHYGDDRDFYECEGTVSFYKGTLVVEWDDHTVQELYQYSQDNLTITGHVPFEEER